MERTSLPNRFWAKVNREHESGCWLWTAGLQTAGYGQVWIDGRSQLAHRLAFLDSGRTIPEGKQLDHLCRVRTCVNPEHLEPVTSRENTHRSPLSVNSVNLQKTHCPEGHPYDMVHQGKRGCRICTNTKRTRKKALARGWVIGATTRKARGLLPLPITKHGSRRCTPLTPESAR